MTSLTEEIVPILTLDPKPPVGRGQRNAMLAAPKADKPIVISVIDARFKNWRLVTPTSSGSGVFYFYLSWVGRGICFALFDFGKLHSPAA